MLYDAICRMNTLLKPSLCIPIAALGLLSWTNISLGIFPVLHPLNTSHASHLFTEKASYSLCFTPGGACIQSIVDVINRAKVSLYVQAYSFTSAAIADALIKAKQRGVMVKVIVDKSQVMSGTFSVVSWLQHAGIPIWVDSKPAIAHNKVMIIDQSIVITGSFNFTKAAEYKNAENLLIIYDVNLAKQYQVNWQHRQEDSILLEDYHALPAHHYRNQPYYHFHRHYQHHHNHSYLPSWL